MTLFYNEKTFAKYGLSVPTTWDEFKADAAKLHQANPNIYFSWFDTSSAALFEGIAAAAGAQPFKYVSSNTWHVDFKSPAMVKVANYWNDLVNSGYAQVLPMWSAQWAKNLADGTYAAFLGCAWSPAYEIAPYVKPNQGWRVAPMPQWTKGTLSTGNWGGSTNAITVQSKNPAAALLFAAWINTSNVGVKLAVTPSAKGGRGLWPVSSYAQNSPILSNADPYLDGQVAAPLFAQSARAVDDSFQWSPWTPYIDSQYGVDINQAVKSHASFASALATLQDQVDQYAQEQGYTVTN
jgi:multiple sugar transport system substrate-binding protein